MEALVRLLPLMTVDLPNPLTTLFASSKFSDHREPLCKRPFAAICDTPALGLFFAGASSSLPPNINPLPLFIL